MSNLYIMVGLPGSGKDFYINNNKKDADVVLSSDGIREELGDVNDQTQNELVFKLLYERLIENIKAGKDCWLNATNVTIKNRAQGIEIGKKYGCNIIAVVMAVPVDVCIEQDKKRDRNVGVEVIKKFAYRFQIPFYEEGFNEIRIIGGALPIDKEYISERMKATEQTSMWHKEDVLEHSQMVERLFNCNNNDIKDYVFYHDIGKIFTQTHDEKGYHFYNHENVGTYYLLWHTINGNRSLEGLFLVNYHMILHRQPSEKSIRKYKKLFGEEKFAMLEAFAKADAEGVIK